MKPQIPAKKTTINHSALWAKSCEVIAERISSLQIEIRAFANQCAAVRGANKNGSGRQIVSRLGKLLWHGANEIEHQFAIKPDVIHSQMSDAAFDIFFARSKSRLKVFDDFGNWCGYPTIWKFVTHDLGLGGGSEVAALVFRFGYTCCER